MLSSALTTASFESMAQSNFDEQFVNYPTYAGTDLEMVVDANGTHFKLWSPKAQQVKVNLYNDGRTGEAFKTLNMTHDTSTGIWAASVNEPLFGKFYTFQVMFDGKWLNETPGVWAKAVGVWIDDIDESFTNAFGERIAEGGEAIVYDHGATLVKTIGLDYFVEPILALDRISLHNAYFPETALTVLGFGRDAEGNFKIVVEQPFIKGNRMSDEEIAEYMRHMGFELHNPRNWTYATPEIYLSDMHDENVIRSDSGNVFVIDCDIRINTPELKCGGVRNLSTQIVRNNSNK